MFWSTASSCFPGGARWRTGWRKPVTRSGAKRKLPSPRRSPDGNGSQGRGRYRLQGEVRLLRPRGIRLQGQARPEPRHRQRDLVDEAGARVDDEDASSLTGDLPQEADANVGRGPLGDRFREHLLLPEGFGQAVEDLGGPAAGHQGDV